MDPSFPPEADVFRAEVRLFLAECLPVDWEGVGAIRDRREAECFVDDWRGTLRERGLLALPWPVQYGGAGRSNVEQVVLAEEFARVGVPTMGPNDTFGIKMVGNTLLRWGTEQQRSYYLPRILSGEDVWCQGYSEPDAGSDLASLTTRAQLDGDQWVIDGQKIWTSGAQRANWIFLLARTDPDAPKNHGISFLLVPLDQPGIEIRPIRQISGLADFNEVFFTGASTPAANVVGQVNAGWAVAQTLLGHERGEEAATNPVLFRAEFDRLRALAVERGRADDPLIRQQLARLFAKVEIMRFLGYRILTGVLHTGTLGPEASISKLFWSEYHWEVTNLAAAILGDDMLAPEGRLPLRAYRADDPGALNTSGSWYGTWTNSVAGRIYAGTNHVQRNILGESVLGLPREPR